MRGSPIASAGLLDSKPAQQKVHKARVSTKEHVYSATSSTGHNMKRWRGGSYTTLLSTVTSIKINALKKPQKIEEKSKRNRKT